MAKIKKKRRSGGVRRSTGDRIVDIIIYVALGLIALCTVLPFLYVIAGSFATDKELTEKAFFIIPEVWSLNAYKYAINTANILRGLKNSIILTVSGTVMCMLFSLTFAYPPVKKAFQGQERDYESGDYHDAFQRRHDSLLSGISGIWPVRYLLGADFTCADQSVQYDYY